MLKEVKDACSPYSDSFSIWDISQKSSHVHKVMFLTMKKKSKKKTMTIDRKTYLYNRMLHSNGNECPEALCVNLGKS